MYPNQPQQFANEQEYQQYMQNLQRQQQGQPIVVENEQIPRPMGVTSSPVYHQYPMMMPPQGYPQQMYQHPQQMFQHPQQQMYYQG